MPDGAPLTFHKVTSMPGAPVANGMYFVRADPDAGPMELVVTADDAAPVALETRPKVVVQAFAETNQVIVNHNLGRRPSSIAVLNSGGVEVIANIVHTSANQFVVELNPPMAGQVLVS